MKNYSQIILEIEDFCMSYGFRAIALGTYKLDHITIKVLGKTVSVVSARNKVFDLDDEYLLDDIEEAFIAAEREIRIDQFNVGGFILDIGFIDSSWN